MRKLTAFSLLLALSLTAQAQEFPRLTKFALAESGFEAYLPAYPDNLELSYTEDNSQMWTGEVLSGDLNFGVIVAEFAEPLEEDAEMQVALLESYLDYLQTQLDITESAGYGRGHTLEDYPGVSGVLDYWMDSEGYNWQIKGWVSQKYLAVLFIGSFEEINVNGANMFLNGIRFPE